MPKASWTDRVWSEFRCGNLTRAYRDALLTLGTFRGEGGLCLPSHATLANRAHCSTKTVQRALRQAQLLGLVSWTERRVRAGWRWLRTSNAYRLVVPEGAVRPGLRAPFPRRATGGQSGRGGESLSKQEADRGRMAALAEFMREAAGMPDLLAARRAAMAAKLLAERRV